MNTEKTIKTNLWFLSGGGEMGQLIREKDWSKTSLGASESWPQSLRTMVAVMLDNPFGMYIAWGNDYTQLYNDGYRPILGDTKHPQALGISTRETFSEIWHIIESMFDGVMKGTSVGVTDFMFRLNRFGYEEECYFDFSYSPIRKDNGEVGGVLVIATETTAKKRATDALKESNARYINNIMQAPVAMCILRGKNHIVEIANELMLEIWGKHTEQVMNKPFFEGLPEAKDQGLEPLLDNVFKTGEKFVANERPVNLPRNGKVETTYLNFVYEALKEADGTISSIVAIATEVTQQVISRSKVEEGEQKVRALVENAPFPIAVYTGKEMIVELANQSIIDIWGKGNDVIGKSFKEVLPELDNQLVFEQIESVLTNGESFHTKNTPLDLVVDGKSQTFYFNYSLTPLYDIGGNVYGVMNTGVDLTDLNIAKKQVEESDKRFRTTVKQAPVGITILRGERYIVEMANDAYLQLVDRTEDKFVGQPLFYSLPEVEESVHSLLDSVLNTGVPYHGNEVEIPVNRYGRQEIGYFDFLYYPLKEEDGQISGVIVTVTEVSEKVEARKKIEEAEEKTRLALNSAELGVYEIIYSTDEMITDSRFKEIWGVDKSVTRNEYAAVIHPDDILQRKQAHEKSIKSGHLDYRARVIWKDESIHWVRVTGKVIYDSKANPVKLIGIIQDITDAVNAREKIEESKEKLNIVIDASELGTYELNLLTDEVIYSDKYLEIFGFGKGVAPTHKELISRLHPSEMHMRNEAFKDSLVSGTLFYQAKVVWNDKSIHWIDVKGKVFYNEEKKPVKLIGTVGDITEEKSHEQELDKLVKERTLELAISSERFSKIFDENPVAMTLSEIGTNKILFANNLFYKYFGYTKEEVIGHSTQELKLISPEEDARLLPILLAYLNETRSAAELQALPPEESEKLVMKLKAAMGDMNLEVLYTRKNGEIFYAIVSYDLIKIDNKTFTITSYQDISEQKKAEKEIIAYSTELERKNKEIEQFAYIASHDLQEPLRSISNFSTLLTQKLEAQPDKIAHEYLTYINGGVNRMSTLIFDLLEYSRIGKDTSKVQIDCNIMVNDILTDLSASIKECEAEIHVAKLPVLSGFIYLESVFKNLISNAIKFRKVGTHPIITISATDKGREFLFEIKDNGIGIEKEYYERIFIIFQRLHTRREYEGTGIGLSQCKKIIELHGGQIWLESNFGKESVFKFTIPKI